MASEQGTTSGYPRIDLGTVRETLAYIHEDMAAAPELARVHQAMGLVLAEIAALAPTATSLCLSTDAKVVPIRRARFVPWVASGSR